MALDSRLFTNCCAPSARASVFLGQGGGEGCNFSAKDAGELDSEMAQTADANHAHAGGRIDPVDAQRVVDGAAGAEQRRGMFAVEGVGDGNDETIVGADAVGVTAIAVHAGGFRFRAEVLLALQAPLAVAAGIGLPAEANALANLESFHLGADRRNCAYDLVTGDERVLAVAPIVGDKVQIAVADSAMRNGDFDFVRPELARIVTERQEFGSRCMGCKSLNLSHIVLRKPH